MSRVITRRALLAIAGTAVLGSVPRIVRRRDTRLCGPTLAGSLAALVAGSLGAVAIGAARPTTDPDAMASHLVRRLDLEPHDVTCGSDGVRPRLVDRVAEEHAAGDVVLVEGWMLSRTEADLYTIAASVG